MNVLCIGDVCGSIGCNTVRKLLPQLKSKHNIDIVIINGENSADGNGITNESAESLFVSGADVITGGNHTLRRKEIYSVLDSNEFLLRPANLPDGTVGKGISIVDLGFTKIAVINLIGRVYLPELSAKNPFESADLLIEYAKSLDASIIIVDIHAEATAEKKALAYYLDGRVSAVFGTHTHVLTADNQILPKGTGFITDIGMTGPVDSVLGVKKELSIAKIKDGAPVKFELADGKCQLNGCIFEIDNKTKMTDNTHLINIII